MPPIILQDPVAAGKLLESILDSPGGRRSLSRLARTCKAMSELSLRVLWRELDSLNPLIGLFPSHLFRKARRPNLGLIKVPLEEDWEKVIAYSKLVHRVSYNEGAKNIHPSVFPIIKEHCPQANILPHLHHLTWRADSAVGLDRATMFLNPELSSLALEVAAKFPQLNSFLTDLASRTRLSSFSFISPIALPDAFTELLLPHSGLQKVVLVAPGALSSGVGKWVALLPHLRNLQLDLSGRTGVAVEGFFDDIRSQSGYSTPRSTDSGVFSGEEMDFSKIRKSSLQLTGDWPSSGWFPELRQLHLTGEASNIAIFLRQLSVDLTQLELVIEDPPSKAGWKELSAVISDRLGHSLQSLRISATASSRFVDLVRSTSRADPPPSHLPLEHLSDLTSLVRLEIDLPQSVVFYASDISCLVSACPNVEVLRLCPLSRFPMSSGPKLDLADLAPLVNSCRRLHTLAITVKAGRGNDEVLASRRNSSRSLLRLHVGHSWVTDPLQVAILLSHFAPHLESLKWFHEKSRSGVVEANAQGWQSVSDFLPHLQNMRLVERASESLSAPPSAYLENNVPTDEREILAKPPTQDAFVQTWTSFASCAVDATPQLSSTSVDARPSVVEVAVQTYPPVRDQGVDACPPKISNEVDATASMPTGESSVEFEDDEKMVVRPQHSYIMWPSMSGLFSFCKVLIFYPFSFPLRIIGHPFSTVHTTVDDTEDSISEKPPVSDSFVASDIPLVGL